MVETILQLDHRRCNNIIQKTDATDSVLHLSFEF
jgi:hypothetical protein